MASALLDTDLWYVIRTKPHAELQVDNLLRARQIVSYLPLWRPRGHSEPLFPGYLFVRLNTSAGDLVRTRSAPGVSYILSSEGQPISVTESLIEELRQRVEEENGKVMGARYASGDRLVVTGGPFRGMDAIFDRSLTPRGRCLVLLEILGRLARVEVMANQLGRSMA